MTGRELYERWARYAEDRSNEWDENSWEKLPLERLTAWEDLAAWLRDNG
jgi:hypothetical protein